MIICLLVLLIIPLMLKSMKATTNPQSGPLQKIIDAKKLFSHASIFIQYVSTDGSRLPHTNDSLELFLHRTNHVAVEIVLQCEVVILLIKEEEEERKQSIIYGL